jgi:hypothetical protein
MTTSILNLFRNRVTAVATLLLVLMAAALGQSVRELKSSAQQAACGQRCTAVCASTACVCIKITPLQGVCVPR